MPSAQPSRTAPTGDGRRGGRRHGRARSAEASLTLIAKTAKRIVELQDMDSLMREVVAAIKDSFGYDFVSLLLVRPETRDLVKREVYGLRREEHVGMVRPIAADGRGGVVGWVAHHRRPALVPDVRRDPRYIETVPDARSELAVPLQVGEKVIGVIDVESVEVAGLDERDQLVLEALADEIAIAIENSRLYEELGQAQQVLQARTEQLQRLLSRTLRLQEEERRRISLDLHDGLVQLLVGSLFQLDAARMSVGEDPVVTQESLARVRGLLTQCVEEMQYIVHDLRPLVLDDLGLHSALERHASKLGSGRGRQVTIELTGPPTELDSHVETVIYRIVQEALANAVKHSQATWVRVRLVYHGGTLVVHVEDDGVGFEYDARFGGGLGLLGMEERARSVGGSLRVTAAPGQGVHVAVEVPLPIGRQTTFETRSGSGA